MPFITFSADINNIHIANDFLHEHIDGNHPKIGMIELALEEILVNVMHYAYKNPEKIKNIEKIGEIELGVRKIRFDNQPFYAIWVKDWGQPFDPFEESPEVDFDVDIEDRPIGGLGIHLVKTVSNHQCYSADDGSNIVEIYFAAHD